MLAEDLKHLSIQPKPSVVEVFDEITKQFEITGGKKHFTVHARMDEAVKTAQPHHYILFGKSIATGTEMYFVVESLEQVENRDMVIMQRPAKS